MTFFFNSVKKFSVTTLIFCFLSLLPILAVADNGYVVAPVQSSDQVRLLSAQAWPHGTDSAELMFKLAYIRGLLDAWQLASVAPKTTAALLQDLAGLSLTELVAAVDSYYQLEEKNRLIPPSSIILRIIPQHYHKRLDQHDD